VKDETLRSKILAELTRRIAAKQRVVDIVKQQNDIEDKDNIINGLYSEIIDLGLFRKWVKEVK
jgi:hypothetical protein